ncbi:hypothetical protein HZS_6622 [Henneguya salminicola]|nr:hypothetical protein HZS_6622 [Henneguya salminicola]
MASLVLKNGFIFQGKPFGFHQDCYGELVLQTGMVGYVESLTDPSYLNQILVFTYPIIGNYGVPFKSRDQYNILTKFESEKIHLSGLIVSQLCQDENFSHVQAVQSLNSWLIEEKICGIEIIDTRELVKCIRNCGSMPAKIIFGACAGIEFPSLSISPLFVSVKTPKIFYSKNSIGVKIIAVDCGIKNSMLRYMLNLGVDIKLVPIDYNFLPELSSQAYHGLFISNGPGDPKICTKLIENVSLLISSHHACPIFGICFGHQIMGLSSGFDTYKMNFGHRGHNQPCKESILGRCYITSQNHGYVVDYNESNPSWKPFFTNLNDNTNEGLYHKSKPYMSVQFHPEHNAGPMGTEFLFTIFVEMLKDHEIGSCCSVDQYYTRFLNSNNLLPLDYKLTDIAPRFIRRVLVLGSGGLMIGQAGEFDYSGSQAIKALKEDHSFVILINPNIATAQTLKGSADSVYFLPVQADHVERVIELERPDAIVLSVGGQTALNCGIELYKRKILEKYNIQVLGTTISSIIATEDRQIFAQKIVEIGEQVPPSKCAYSIEEAVEATNIIGFPLLVRSAYTLGGSGSGLAVDESSFKSLASNAFSHSSQIIIDKFLVGWKEIEYEILRDSNNDCITVCNLENLDPVGIHTGDSIVVAPSQTLTDYEYHSLRDIAIKVARHFNIIGECNIQFAVDQRTSNIYIIEVNARLSRSSALASKATGYPLAYISTKIALGLNLCDLKNVITITKCKTQWTTAFFEPSLDYIVVKVPRWDLDKFLCVDRTIGTSMKSVGEVMGIGRNFAEGLQKAIRMTGTGMTGLDPSITGDNIEELLEPNTKRIHGIARSFYLGYSIEQIHKITQIDRWFLHQIKLLVDQIKALENIALTCSINNISPDFIRNLKQNGFSDKQIGRYFKCHETFVQSLRYKYKILPVVKRIDTVSAEYPSTTNYFYLTYNGNEHDDDFQTHNSIMVLGSGPYRIGSSVEFDCCSVSCVRELRRMNHNTIMLNCNPETVSTDFDECDRMYFDEISVEVVYDIYKLENPDGVILCMSGQTPNNIASSLHALNVKILGTHPEMIDNAENRFKFSRLLDELNIFQPTWRKLTTHEEALVFCATVGYPCLVRPSYVLSGEAMNVAFSDDELKRYLCQATDISIDHPVVISKFFQDCKEIDVDAVANNGKLVCVSIAEHIERAGVHSGDSTAILPTISINKETFDNIIIIVKEISKNLHINGPFNLQLIAKENNLYVIECNLRVSRSFPFSSKYHDVDFVSIATKCIMGSCSFEYFQRFDLRPKKYSVKAPQFSFHQLKGAEVISGVEMHSTGEIACFGHTVHEAFLKTYMGTGFKIPARNIWISIEPYKMKMYLQESIENLVNLGYNLYADDETFDFYYENGVSVKHLPLGIASEILPQSLSRLFNSNEIELVAFITHQSCFNLIRNGTTTKSHVLTRFCIDNSISLITNAQIFKMFAASLNTASNAYSVSREIDSIQSGNIIRLPYLVDCHTHMREPGGIHKEDFSSGTRSAIAGGISCVLCMPNTIPPLLDGDSFHMIDELARTKCICDYGLIAGSSMTNAQNHYVLSKKCPALKLYLNPTFTSLRLEGVTAWLQHFETWSNDLPICVHAEGETLAVVLNIAHIYKKKIHVCHVSKKNEIETIKMAKLKNPGVTCEVCPHHLFLTSDYSNVIGEKRIRVKPELGTLEDQQSLWNNLDIIDCFASDHAPHTLDEKDSDDPPPGFPGVETMLTLLLTAVNQKRLTLDDVILRLHTNPMKIFNIPPQPNSFVEVNMNSPWSISSNKLHSRANWTPFENFQLSASVDRVVIRGVLVYVGGKFIVDPGFGINVFTQPQTSMNSLLLPTLDEVMVVDKLIPLRKSIKNEETDLLLKLLNLEEAKWFHGKSFITVKHLDRGKIKLIFNIAREVEALYKVGHHTKLLEGKILALAFVEPSTRTLLSFQSAMQKLGGSTIILRPDSSMVKGETFEDTVKALSCFADALVIRHDVKGTVGAIAKTSTVPIINGGDGIGEHPTQALLDFFTIRQEIGTINNLTISLIGDLKNGRTTHSFALLAIHFTGIIINYVTPKGLEMPQDIKDYLKLHNIPQHEYRSIEDVIKYSDVVYMTRIQKERFESQDEYLKYKGGYILSSQIMSMAKEKMIVMHPLPRIDEIEKNIDFDPRCAYFRQMVYGMYTRMALLLLTLGPYEQDKNIH